WNNSHNSSGTNRSTIPTMTHRISSRPNEMASKPGRAVEKAASRSTPASTRRSASASLATAALEQDDAVATLTVKNKGGMYIEAYADVALEGPAWMRRNFLEMTLHRAAQLDHDSLSHAAAMQATIAAAAKTAHNAQTDAALASKRAATARNAAAEAQQWADKAIASANEAKSSAKQASDNAAAADKSAADARASADKAQAAATTAKSAARTANYSANRAVASARSAVASANSASNSAANARASSIAAGQDATTAANAAADARQIAAVKRTAEIKEAARKAAEEAQKNRNDRHNPTDSPDNDQVNPGGAAGGDQDEWWNDAKWYADTADNIAVATGLLALGAGVACVFYPAAPVLGSIAAISLGVSVIFSIVSTVATGIEYGFSSSKFSLAAGNLVLGLMTRGGGRVVTGTKSLVGKAEEVGEDVGGFIAKQFDRVF
ncbi:DUF308 domain-containing protein, partial [Streptomyces globisporus]